MVVDVTCDNDRGIQSYGEPVICVYGSKVSVTDSSSAERIACWLWVDDRPWASPGGKSAAHMEVDHVKALIERLQTFVDRAEAGQTPFGGLIQE